MTELVTVKQLAEISQNADPAAFDLAGDVKALVPEMEKAKITTRPRIAAFLANVCQETDRLNTLEEYGDEAYFRSFLGAQWRYHGRGYIMNTWRDAYARLSKVLGVDLVKNPDLLATRKDLAAKAAVWFWTENGLNAYADRGDFRNVCSIINTGQPGKTPNGLDMRLYFHRRALDILPANLGGSPVPDERSKTPAQLAEEAIEFGLKLIGAPYGTGWEEGTWPALSPLYSKIGRHDSPAWYREREIICSALINVLRFEVAGLPAVGRKQGDDWPGGTAAIGRHLAFADGSKPYPPVENTPRGWLVYSPYISASFNPFRQGHVGIALGNGYVLEARVPLLTKNRTENEGHRWLVTNGGGKGYQRIIPPSLWLRK